MAKFGDLQKKIDEEEAKFRSEQEVRNHKQMDELAKIHPIPTVADLNEAMSVKDAAVVKAVESKPAESKATTTTKASEQEQPHSQEGSYKTRASTSRRE